MAVTTPLPGQILRREPYFDDYDATKQFYQILFKAGLAPQARELTQLQTGLQEQIGRFGNWAFRNGSTVTGAQTSISRGNAEGTSREITLTPGIVYFNHRFLAVCNNLIESGQFIINLDNGTNNFETTIQNTLDVAMTATDTTLTLRDASTFPATGVVRIDNEFISYTSKDGNVLQGLGRGALTSTATAHVAGASVLNIVQRTGIRNDNTNYTFTYNGASSESYNENPSTNAEYDTWFNSRNFQVGFRVVEDIVSSTDDESLLDNSVGSLNLLAPGADRLRITLSLDIRPLNQEYPDFIFQIRVLNGNIIEQKIEQQYNEILNYFARQLRETQGDYTIDPHNANVLEWSAKELAADPSRQDTFALNVSSGRAYVNGFRRERLVPTRIAMSKGYSDISLNFSGNGLQYRAYDSFVVNLTSLGAINLNKIMALTVNVGGTQNYYAWVREIEKIGTTTYRVFFSDASNLFYNNFTSGASISFFNSEVPTALGTATAQGTVTENIQFTSNKAQVYNTMPDAVNFSDLTGYTKSYETTLIPASTSTFTLDNTLSGETSPSNASSFTLTNTNPGNTVFVIDNNGASYTSGFVLTNTGTNQISWTTTPPSSPYRVYYRAYAFGSDTTSTERTQLRNTNTTAAMNAPTQLKPTENVDQFIGGGTVPGFYDVFRINSVTDTNGTVYRNGVDYVLVDGQTPEYFYGSAIRWLRNRNRPSVSYTIDFNYWLHQGPTTTSASGSMITADSFSNVDGTERDYLNISTYLGRRRSDIIDFRTRNSRVSIVDDTYTIGDPSQNTVDARKRTRRNLNDDGFFYDVQRYLPRFDTLFIDKDGEFTLLRGTPRISPEKPRQPENSLLIANIFIPAYPRNTGDVKIELWDSLRYRQEDIKRLERRVANLETFVLQNKLELLAINQELDVGDTRRGVMVDDFSGFGVADVNNPEYTAAIDPVEGALRLPFTHEFFDISFDLSNFDSIGSNILIGDKTVTLDFVENSYIENLTASTTFNVNPYDVFEWLGVMELSPSTDVWVDTNVQPEIISNDNLRNSHFNINNPVNGYNREFNFWQRFVFGLDREQVDPNTRFQNAPPVSVTDAQVTGGLNVSDRSDYTENELTNSSRAFNLKLDGLQTNLT